MAAKDYACQLMAKYRYGVYAITLNKRRVFEYLADSKPRFYNYVARLVIDRIPFETADGNVLLTVDKSKGSAQRGEFNAYIAAQLEGRLDPVVKLDITHENSERSAGLQFVDMCAWAIHRKYERGDEACLSLLKDKVLYEKRYL